MWTLSSHLKVKVGGYIVWVFTENHCISPKLLDVSSSILEGCFIKKPLFIIPVGYVWFANKLALNLVTVSVTSKFTFKSAPAKNCCVDSNPLPVYHVPPPCVKTEDAGKDPEYWTGNVNVDYAGEKKAPIKNYKKGYYKK